MPSPFPTPPRSVPQIEADTNKTSCVTCSRTRVDRERRWDVSADRNRSPDERGGGPTCEPGAAELQGAQRSSALVSGLLRWSGRAHRAHRAHPNTPEHTTVRAPVYVHGFRRVPLLVYVAPSSSYLSQTFRFVHEFLLFPVSLAPWWRRSASRV